MSMAGFGADTTADVMSLLIPRLPRLDLYRSAFSTANYAGSQPHALMVRAKRRLQCQAEAQGSMQGARCAL